MDSSQKKYKKHALYEQKHAWKWNISGHS